MQAKRLKATLFPGNSSPDNQNPRNLPTSAQAGAHKADADEDDDALLAALPTDVEVAVRAVVGQYSLTLAAANLPMLVMRSQIYSQWQHADRTALDRELEELRRSNKLRVFRMATGQSACCHMTATCGLSPIKHDPIDVKAEQQQPCTSPFPWFMHAGADDLGVMQAAVYAQHVRATAAAQTAAQGSSTAHQRMAASSGDGRSGGPSQAPCPYQAAATTFIDCVLPQHAEALVSEQHLHATISKHLQLQSRLATAAHAAADAERTIMLLLNMGCLARSPYHTEAFIFCVPGLGPLVKCITAGRKELLAWLAKRRYKEAGEALLLKAKLRGAGALPLRYLLQDLLGRGDVLRMDTPGGAVIRLAQRA